VTRSPSARASVTLNNPFNKEIHRGAREGRRDQSAYLYLQSSAISAISAVNFFVGIRKD
jgi:hypothetical protein